MKRVAIQVVLLALSVALTGCGSWRGATASGTARGPEPHREPTAMAPPAAAPALFIPGPTPLASAMKPLTPHARIQPPITAEAPLPPTLPKTLPALVPTAALLEPAATGQAAGDSSPSATGSPFRALAKKAMDRYAVMNTYVMRMRRREVIGGSAKAEEVILCKIRTAPFSVYMKWIGKESNGREVIYVKG